MTSATKYRQFEARYTPATKWNSTRSTLLKVDCCRNRQQIGNKISRLLPYTVGFVASLYLGQYTSWGKPKIPPADRILMDPSHKARKNPSDNADLGFQAVGPALRMMQLNVEGLSAAKRHIIHFGWPVMVNDTHTRRRRSWFTTLRQSRLQICHDTTQQLEWLLTVTAGATLNQSHPSYSYYTSCHQLLHH